MTFIEFIFHLIIKFDWNVSYGRRNTWIYRLINMNNILVISRWSTAILGNVAQICTPLVVWSLFKLNLWWTSLEFGELSSFVMFNVWGHWTLTHEDYYIHFHAMKWLCIVIINSKYPKRSLVVHFFDSSLYVFTKHLFYVIAGYSRRQNYDFLRRWAVHVFKLQVTYIL